MVPSVVVKVISYVILTYNRTFSNREPIPFSKAHTLSYTHSKVGNDQRVSKKPAGVLMVIWSGFLDPTRVFSKRPPPIFRKHMPWGIGTESLGMMGCMFAENGPLECGIESSFSGTGWGAKGDFRWIFYPNPCICERGPHHFSNAHALRYGHRKFGDDRMYIRGELGP